MDQKMKDIAVQEAKTRMELLGIKEADINSLMEGDLFKIRVIHSEKKIMKEELTLAEKEMIKRIEEEKDILVYYVIKDTGLWPDGAEFERYTLAFVDACINDYSSIKDDYIETFHTLPAYMVNMEEPDCSGIEEFEYRIINGVMINAS